MIDKELLAKEAKSFGVSLSSATVDILDSFSVYVSEQNKLFNLTAITEGREFTEKHLIDSLSAVQFIPENSTLCDIGAGAGFPSFPIAAVRRDVNVTALDSTSKKTSFILRAANAFGISKSFRSHGKSRGVRPRKGKFRRRDGTGSRSSRHSFRNRAASRKTRRHFYRIQNRPGRTCFFIGIGLAWRLSSGKIRLLSAVRRQTLPFRFPQNKTYRRRLSAAVRQNQKIASFLKSLRKQKIPIFRDFVVF